MMNFAATNEIYSVRRLHGASENIVSPPRQLPKEQTMIEEKFESTGSYGADIEKSEDLFLNGQLKKLPTWHPVNHMYEEEITREFLMYLRRVWSLEKELRPFVDAALRARRSKDDATELAACQEILSAWMAFRPLKKQAIERFSADYYINRVSIIQVRLKRPNEAIATINSYYQSPYYDYCKNITISRHQEIAKRLTRAISLAKRSS